MAIAWLSHGLIKCIIKKNKLFKIYKKNHTVSNNSNYKKYKNCLSKILKKSRKSLL